MRILVVGSGGVGAAFAPIAARRGFYEHIVFADYDETRARSVVERYDRGTGRFSAARVDASDPSSGAAGATCVDMAMSLSEPHAERPHEEAGKKLGDDQFELAGEWEERGLLALVGCGVEPGLSDVFARYAADQLFATIDEVGVRDGSNITVAGYDFAPSFSIWTTIEECLNPPVIWEEDRGWFTTAPFSEPEAFVFPEGIGPVECVNVEHEEVLLVPRFIECKRVTFKYGLGDEFIEVLKTLHKLGLDSKEPLRVKGGEVAPRDVVAAALPDPA